MASVRRATVLSLIAVVFVGATTVVLVTRDDPGEPAGSTGGSTPAPVRSVGGGRVADPYFVGSGNTGYDVDHYDLRLRYDPRHPGITARTTITATASRRLDAFHLDLRGLTVDRVTVDGEPARRTRDGIELVVTPRRSLARGQAFVTEVRYHGVPRPVPDPTEDDPADGFTLGWNRAADGDVYVVSEPTGARSWFPGNDHPSDKATFSITVTVPDAYAVASNGRVRVDPAAPGSRAWRWTMDRPMATYLATVVIAPMREQRTASPAGVPIRNYFPRARFDRDAADFARTGEMIDYFASLYGEYPFGEYGVVTVDDDLGFALENQTMSVFGRDMLGTGPEAQATVAHELAHQWFGDSVGIRRWSDIWLNEGFAEYSQYLWLAHAEPAFDLDAFLDSLRAELAAELAPIADPGASDAFAISVYERGALTLHALRRTVGDEDFFAILRTWATRYRYRTATTAQFEALATEISGDDLAAFFDDWLRAPDVPPLPTARG
jgi:aminopeptidase N